MRFVSILFLTFLFAGCNTSEKQVPEIESINGVVESDITAGNSELNSENTVIWSFYEATIGEYDQQIIIELATDGMNVSGRYFYAKHQRFLTLMGTFDTLNQYYHLTESYKGVPTGYLDFELTDDLCIQGNWMKDQDTSIARIPFMGKKLDLFLNNREQMNVRFAEFEREHDILNHSLNGNSPIKESVLDEFKISLIDQKHFAFYFHTISDHAHLGTLQGIATLVEKDYAIFNATDDNCMLSFRFFEDSIVIEEEENCSNYRGANAIYNSTVYRKLTN
ncbi:MAG: hypothetical protein MK066_12565 [Crocinitomicaceae bacterium]|nr:hypothetical protein [Crocinitomicaceae bacterium]